MTKTDFSAKRTSQSSPTGEATCLLTLHMGKLLKSCEVTLFPAGANRRASLLTIWANTFSSFLAKRVPHGAFIRASPPKLWLAACA